MINTFKGQALVSGIAEGEALVTNTPLSFWGGVDAKTGCVIDRRHDLCGVCLTGKVLFIPQGRGSCSSSGIILEMIRAGTAPAAIIAIQSEAILATGSIIGRELYGRTMPVITVSEQMFKEIQSGDYVRIDGDCIRINH